ncbi:unnamed protein product [[Candida] boidinii]|uniref:Unnamed protein product n=1 Tax=Candida boidinii TaxID=5477 RepID=A0A9W6WFK8_CANBO|nr:unnamed protein product [[Candida] boidinii]
MQVLKNSNINKNDELELFNKSSNELFTEYSIRDIETLNLKLSNTIDVSKDELRTLVGSKYRDLLNVADNIIVMRELSIIQNDKLNNLIFKKSNYNNNKSLVNLNNLNNSIKSNNLSLLKSKNNSIILRNLVHDLNISFFELKFLINNYNNLNDLENKDNKLNKNITNDNSTNNNTASINDSNDDESSINSIQLEKISNHFLELSKQFLLVENLFKDELNTTTFASNKSIKSTVLKFKSLKSNYIKILKLQLQKFLIDNEFEFILNLLLSLSIIKKISPFECLKIFLNLRLNYLNFKFNSVSNINNCLYYIFNTLSYISIFRSKLSTHLIRIFYSSNNQFNNSNNKTNNNTNSNINNPNLNLILKFSKWLDVDSTNFKFEFPLNILQIKNSINKLKIEDECNDFKLKISDFLLNLFKKNLLLNNNNLNDLSTILLKFLNSFKKFSSLIDLKINENENLIENLINLWNSKYIEILEKNLLKFNNIKLIINQNFLNNNIIDFKNILINKNNNPLLSIGNNLFQITELSKINDYIINLQSSNDQHSSATPTTTITASTIISNEELLSNINIYKSILNSSFKSIQLISKLSSTISKPILSIDDYEDDEYWENININQLNFKFKYFIDLIQI